MRGCGVTGDYAPSETVFSDSDEERSKVKQPEFVTVILEASRGCLRKPGEKVRKGDKLGILPGFAGDALSPVDGIIKSVGFSSDTHTLWVVIGIRAE